jgi:hypothetical protein
MFDGSIVPPFQGTNRPKATETQAWSQGVALGWSAALLRGSRASPRILLDDQDIESRCLREMLVTRVGETQEGGSHWESSTGSTT